LKIWTAHSIASLDFVISSFFTDHSFLLRFAIV